MTRAGTAAILWSLSQVIMELVDDSLEQKDETANAILGRVRDGIIAAAEEMEKADGLD